ncbi:PREDICTED: TNF receptor-associated factor 3-like [Amphimedon queenslandica]|uniref:RING-type domain-containing protein n=1 Tax=Amphimedon queenslandica TaxID=400682 RepID=A0AAN0IRZ4_AMPQE|nr:PREDICTED: TNF receptor-associated factor 3-like [Amphimedon queenslandica]|eukprot:XP_011408283.1 PREDICTED: TNF receptor-associated factor 3-like [Amphimedon queenslandica]
MAQKEELSFVEDLPKHVEIECPVCLNILTDPHQVTCCGHNFCGSCIERVKASNGSCPMCKEKEYQSFIDKKCSQKREGECQYEEVKCRYEKCQERKQRRYLEDHEDRECPYRPFQCQYCREEGTFLSITKDHYEECRQYPVTCPNECSSNTMPRGSLTAHINECPLEPVDYPNFMYFYPRELVPNISLTDIVDIDIPLIEDAQASYQQLPHDILNSIRSTSYMIVPQGVIKKELSSHENFAFDSATIYIK